MTAQDNARISREIYEAFNAHEFDRALEHVAEEAECELYADGLSFQGKEGFREMMAHHKAPWPDGEVEVVRQLASDDGVANAIVAESDRGFDLNACQSLGSRREKFAGRVLVVAALLGEIFGGRIDARR